MKDARYYDTLPWEVRIERDLWQDGTVYYLARHPEFGDLAGPVGTGASPEEALAALREARRSLIAVLLERGAPIQNQDRSKPLRCNSPRPIAYVPTLPQCG